MIEPEPPTEVEIGGAWVDPARKLFSRVEIDPVVLAAYRAGFRDGDGTPPEQDIRVYRDGDPEPGDDVTAVVDEDGTVWKRCSTGWGIEGTGNQRWTDIVANFGPMVFGIPDPMSAYFAALDAAEQAAGGAR